MTLPLFRADTNTPIYSTGEPIAPLHPCQDCGQVTAPEDEALCWSCECGGPADEQEGE